MNKRNETRGRLPGRLIAVVFLLGLMARASHAAPTPYFVTDLGVNDGGSYSRGHAINNNSEVVGQYDRFGNGRAFIWTSATGMQSYSGYSGTTSSPDSINDLGQTAGYSTTNDGDRAYLWTTQNFEGLGTLPGGTSSSANGINNSGQVVGSSDTVAGNRAFIWTEAEGMQSLGALAGGTTSAAQAVNNNSQVAGYSGSDDGTRAFLWTSAGGMQSLGTLPGATSSSAFGINNNGQVVGNSSNPGGPFTANAFIWTSAGGMQSLGRLAGDSISHAGDINDSGQAVGYSGSDEAGNHAVIWTSADGMTDLNNLLDPITGINWVLTFAKSINNKGQIVGTGLHNGQERAFLLTPQTPANAPVATDGAVNTNENTPVDIDLAALVSDDATSDANLIYTIVSAPPAEEGTLSGTASTRTFTPAANYSGQSSFTYKVENAGGLGSETKTVTINVTTITPPADGGGKIAFWSNRDGDAEIYVMNADGSNQTRLTHSPGTDRDPVFNADGNKIVFTSMRDNNDEIYIMDADGSNQTRLTFSSEHDWRPGFSADGSKIVFISERDVDYYNYFLGEIYIIGADGSNETRLTYGGSVLEAAPAFSPDGSKIVFTSGRDGRAEIYRMDTDGSNVTRLTNSDGPTSNYYPAFSPDGSKIVFTRNWDIYVMNADGSGIIRLTERPVDLANLEPVFSPNGGKIAFTSERDIGQNAPEIYAMDADGGNQTRLTNNTAADGHPSWAPGYVPPPSQAPTAAADTYTLDEDSGASTLDVLDNDNAADAGDELSITDATQPQNGTVEIAPDGKSLSYTPDENFNDSDWFEYTISDGNGGSAVATVHLTIAPIADAPILDAIGDQSVDAGSTLAFIANATDADGDNVTYSLQDAPTGASIDPDTGTFSWEPTQAQQGQQYSFTIRATDDSADQLSDEEAITVTVGSNTPPELAPIADANGNEGELFSFFVTASDGDSGQTLTLSATGLPTGATFNALTGEFRWTPTEAQGPGIYNVTFTVSDGAGGTDSQIVKLTVLEVNLAPALEAIGDKAIDEASTLAFTATATDADLPANSLTYSLTNAPAGASINAANGAFSWTPTEVQGGADYTFTVKVTDNGAPQLSDEESITVTVNETNQAPTLNSVPDKIVNEGSTLAFTVGAADGDLPAQTLTYSLVGAPAGASIGGATGEFSWTPTEAQGPNTYNFAVRVSDGIATAEQPIKATVNEVNAPPVLPAIGSKSVNEGSSLAFTISPATDSDLPANTLTYSATGLPTGASFNTSTRAFSWTPTEVQGPGSYNVTFKVSDGQSSDQKTVAIAVREVNSAPVLTALAARTVTGGKPLTFTAGATDSDRPNQVLTYSLTNGNAYVSINPQTGLVSGTPPVSATGYNFSIGIRVTDNGTPVLSDTKTVVISVLPPPVIWVESTTWSATEGTLTYLLRNRSGKNLSNVSVQGIVRTAVRAVTRTRGTTSTQAQSGGRTLVKWNGFSLANGADATLTIRAARPAGSNTPVADAFSLAFTASGLQQPLSSLPVQTP